ncbi:MAG: DUF5667 domain-containing protein [bacterium]
MTEKIEIILDWCIDYLREGKSIEYCLKQYPGYAQKLEPLLRLTQGFNEVPKPEPSNEALNLTLLKIGEAAAEQRKKRRLVQYFFKIPLKINTPAWANVLGIILILFIFMATIKGLSARSLPGGWLYPIKLSSEKVLFSLTRDPEDKALLRITYSNIRLDELIQTTKEQGSLDRIILKELLKEAALALYEAQTIEDEKFAFFLTKIKSLNCYHELILEKLKYHVSEKERAILDKALEICNNRKAWLTNMMDEEEPGAQSRRWGPGCLCKDL